MKENKEENRHSTYQLTIPSGFHSTLVLIKKEILESENPGKLTHSISIKDPGEISGICPDSEFNSIYAAYSNSNQIVRYDIKTGNCIKRQTLIMNDKKTVDTNDIRNWVLINPDKGKFSEDYTPNEDAGHYLYFNVSHLNNNFYDAHDGCVLLDNENGTFGIYTIRDWKLIKTINTGSGSRISSAKVVGIKKQLILGYQDGMVKIFNYVTGELLFEEKVADEPIISIAYSEHFFCPATEHKVFFCHYSGRVIELFCLEHKMIQVKISYEDNWYKTKFFEIAKTTSAQFLYNTIVINSSNGELLIYDIIQKVFVLKFPTNSDFIENLLVRGDGLIFYTTSEKTVHQVNFHQKKLENVFYEIDGNRSIAVSGDSKYLCISGIVDNKAKLIDFSSGKTKYEFKHQRSVRTVAFGSVEDTEFVFTAGWDGIVKQWRISDGTIENQIELTGNICDMKITGNVLYAAFYPQYSNGGFCAFDLKKRKMLYTCRDHRSVDFPGRTIAVLPHRHYVYSAGDDGIICKYENASGNKIMFFNHGISIRSLAISKDGNRIFSSAIDGTIKIWNTETGNLLRMLQGHNGRIYSMVLSEDDSFLFSADVYGTINKFCIDTGIVQYSYCSPSNCRIWMLKTINNGKILISCSEDFSVGFFDTEKLTRIGSYYNLYNSFLWTLESEDNNSSEYYWTDRPDLITIFNNDNSLKTLDDKKEKEEYHRVYNNQKVVMSRLNNTGYFNIHKSTLTLKHNQKQIENLIGGKANKLIT